MIKDQVFILTTEPPEQLGGMEQFVRYLAAGLKERGYDVRIFHRENSVPLRWRHPDRNKKWKSVLDGLLLGYFTGRAAKAALHPAVRLVVSNSTVGWYPLGQSVPQAHIYHGTYRHYAEANRRSIRYRGYLKLKWWDSMVLEKWSGKGKIVLCVSDLVRDDVRLFFGYEGQTVWLPLDLEHFCSLDRKSCRQSLGISDTVPVGLFVGSALPTKGFSAVEQLVRDFPQIQWLLALRGHVPAEVGDLSNARLFHHASFDSMPVLYNAADLSLCPSRYESFPYVVAESLSCGTPVIASPHGGSLTFHRDTALRPLLVGSTDDTEGFKKAVQLVLSDPKGWRSVVQNEIRPLVERLMAPQNWWPRFREMTGL